MKNRQKTVARLLVPLGLVLLIAMIAVWGIAVKLLTDTIDRRLDDQLIHATETLAAGEFPFSLELIVRLDRLIEARIALLDGAGAVALSTTNGPEIESLQDIAKDIGANSAAQVLTRHVGDSSWRIAIQPLQIGRDSRFSYVAAIASTDASRKAANDAAKLLGLAMLVVTVLLAWIGHRFTGLAKQSRLAGLGELSSRIAHEVRNPLTAIKMQLQLLGEKSSGDDATRVDKLLVEIRRMETMVESVLTAGSPLELRIDKVKPDALIEDLTDLLRPSLLHRDIELRADATSATEIDADADRLKQALLNLINNAADELGNGGVIKVSTGVTATAGTVDISVADSGPGLAARPNRPDSQKPFGLGLGLAICREIAERHNGELIEGSSSSLGGAKFTLRLPVRILLRSQKTS